ncbi:EF-P 5-aminopentanol modification-associated protein YfmF [Culicoidibacter larvae]|uniref:Insulinase family protein n=1 Tax=Culicoidibacter larvae TaxID=2579976 RepID=A0A5R8QEP9_9FIRM|nr:pitrilysin family protein [Culicoidibacter larvae]TLG74267.1 insulinase family protein [Culicoidibacter larvae]
MIVNKQEWQGLNINTIQTEKFKTLTFIVQFKNKLKADSVAARSLATILLKKATKKYPSNKALQKYLDTLYGARLTSSISRKGDLHQTAIQLTVLNPAYVADESYTIESIIQFLYEVIYQPAEENGGFLNDEFTVEKRNLEETIKATYNDKIQYSLQRLNDIMCADEPYIVRAYGVLEDYGKLTAANVFQYYKKMLAEDEIKISIIGDLAELPIESMFKTIFPVQENHKEKIQMEFFPKIISEVKAEIEHQDITQSKLNIGLRTNIFTNSSMYFAMKVAIGILGGFPHSKLFTNVREKASLAYYASSYYDGSNGMAIIYAGIEAQNLTKADAIIREQITDMLNGTFSDEDLSMTKRSMINDLREAADSVGGMSTLVDAIESLPAIYSLEDWLAAFDRVTRADVVSAMQHVQIDTTYILTSEGEVQ